MSEWIAQRQEPAAWLALDEEDHDLDHRHDNRDPHAVNAVGVFECYR